MKTLHLMTLTATFAMALADNRLNILKEFDKTYSLTSEITKLNVSYTSVLDSFCQWQTDSVSELCAIQITTVCDNFNLMIYMADAWSKAPYPGMLTATRQEWGAFDQCTSIDHRPDDGPRLLGKHCANGLALPVNSVSLHGVWSAWNVSNAFGYDPVCHLPLHAPPENSDGAWSDKSLIGSKPNAFGRSHSHTRHNIYLFSYCVPDACRASDVAALLGLDQIGASQLVNEIFCTTKESNSQLNVSTITVACLFCLFAVVVVLSTIYEVYLDRRHIKCRRPIFLAFSVLNNGKKLMQTVENKDANDQIQAFHGIKVVSMLWIIAGHGAALFSQVPVTNREQVEGFEKERYSMYLATAHLAVDTFFFISGFLLAYQYFKGQANKPILSQVMSIPNMIIHRYLRITPVVLMFFLYSVYLAKHVGDGPIFTYVHDQMNEPCRRYWWSVFLYVQNYVNRDDICWVHLWYLSADWQLFLLAPLVLIPIASQFRRRFKIVMCLLVLLNVFFLSLALYIKLGFPEFDPEHLEYDTHSKLTTYFMGIMFGFCFRCQKHKQYIFKKGVHIFMWCFSLGLLLGAVMILHEVNINDSSHTIKSITEVFLKPVWCLALAFVVYSCTSGYGGIVNSFLTTGYMQVLSKLTFCMYIVHMPVIVLWLATKRTREHFSDYILFFYCCGHFILTVIVAIFWSLTFESPLITIEKGLFGRGGQRPVARNNDKRKSLENGITILRISPLENGKI